MSFFISYAREDRDFVRRLHEALAHRQHDGWVDWEDIPLTAKWIAEIYAGIDAADAFVFVISPESALSETCRLEIARAVEHNKRLIPVLRREVDARAVPDSVSALNWVLSRESDDFDVALEELLKAGTIDLVWLHAHTRLLVRALDWEARARDESLLLRGRDLVEAEDALASAGPSRPPAPTALQIQYVLLSRQAATRRRRSTIGAIGLGAAVAVALGYAAWTATLQRNVQHTRASANSLAAQAQLVRDQGANQLPLSLLLALESERIAPSPEAQLLIGQTLRMLPMPVGRLPHESGVRAVAFSADGRFVATTAENDAIARVWDVADRREIHSLRHTGDIPDDISSVAFTPDGSRLLTAGIEGVTIWDLASEEQVGRPIAATAETLGVSPDGKYVAIGTLEGDVIARELSTGHEQFRGNHDIIVNALAWSPDGRNLLSGSNDKTARVWDLSGHEVLSLPHQSGVMAVAWSPNSELIATGGWEGLARVWARATGRERARFDVKSPIHAIAFSTDSARLIAAADDRTTRIWDLTSGSESGRITHGEAVQALAVSPDGRSLATGSKDRTAALWDIGGELEALRLAHPESIGTSVAYSPDGSRLATVSGDTVRVWEMPGGRELARFAHGTDVSVARFTADGRSLVTATEANSDDPENAWITVWAVDSGEQTARLSVKNSVTAFSADGQYFASANFKEGALVRESSTGNDVARIARDVAGRFPAAVALSPRNRYVAASIDDGGGKNSAVLVWAVVQATELCQFKDVGSVRALVFSDDGLWLAGGAEDGSARVWEIEGCRSVARIAQTAEVRGVTFSADRKLLATASRNQTARVWSLPAGVELARLTFGGVVNGVAFSPDGRYVAAASSDRTTRVWQWRPDGDPTAGVCARVGRSLTQEEWHKYLGDEPYRETCKGLTDAEPDRSTPVDVVVAKQAPPADIALITNKPSPAEDMHAPDTIADHEIVIRNENSRSADAVAVSPNGHTLAIADSAGIAMWNLTTGRFEKRVLAPESDGAVTDAEMIAFSPDGKRLAGTGGKGSVWLLDIASGSIVRNLGTQSPQAFAFSPDGTLIAEAHDEKVSLWDVASGTELRQFNEHTATVNSLAFSPDAKLLASGGEDNTTRLWEVSTGRELRRITGAESNSYQVIDAVAFSPDSRLVFTGALQVVDARSGKEKQPLEELNGPLEQLAFSPRGDLLAGKSIARIVLWNPVTGRLISELKSKNGIGTFAFTPDGRRLVSAANQDYTTIWDVAARKPLAKLIAIGDSDWAVTTPDGHFDGSPAGVAELRFYQGGQPVSLKEASSSWLKPGLLAVDSHP